MTMGPGRLLQAMLVPEVRLGINKGDEYKK